jgi:hypothetical protein
MSKVIVTLIKKNVSSIEINQGVIWLLFNCLIKIFLCEIILADMIVGEATVIIMEWMLL